MRFRRTIGVVSLTAVPLMGTLVLAPTATAAVETVSCGQRVDHSLTLANDIGPCPGDGLIITASGIRVELNGHTITGSNTTNQTANEQVGIRLANVSRVTVTGPGTVKNFDAGVAVEEGAENTIEGLTATENINHSALTGAVNDCFFGDGIVVFDSSRNTIANNTAENNGPFDGIGLIGNSDDNVVRNNQSNDNRSLNRLPNGRNGPCGPFQGGGAGTGGVGRADQNIGIRVEGPGANNNLVHDNGVDNNLLDGISVHGHVCAPPAGSPVGQPQPENSGNVIRNNTVTNNGYGLTNNGDGIAILRQGPFGVTVCPAQRTTIQGNTVTGNADEGIFLPALSSNNNVRANVVNDNGGDGILVQGPFTICPRGQFNRNAPGMCNVPREPRAGSTDNQLVGNRGAGNGHHDGHDDNPDCDNNQWRGNRFVTVNQPCVAQAGGSGKVPPGLANAAERPNDDAGGNSEEAQLGQRRGRP